MEMLQEFADPCPINLKISEDNLRFCSLDTFVLSIVYLEKAVPVTEDHFPESWMVFIKALPNKPDPPVTKTDAESLMFR